MNSYELIGRRLAAEAAFGPRGATLYVPPAQPEADTSLEITAIRSVAMGAIQEADVTSVINLKLHSKRDEIALFDVMLDEHGPQTVVAAITTVIARCQMDGKKVNTWRYCVGSVAEYDQKTQFDENGFRPGTTIGRGPGAPDDIPF